MSFKSLEESKKSNSPECLWLKESEMAGNIHLCKDAP